MKKHTENKFFLFGIIGRPLTHTLSPAMHNAALGNKRCPGLYMPFDLPKKALKSYFQSLREFSISGLNVTVPYKETVIPYMDQLTSDVKKIGAVNTIERKGNKLIGHNTDVYGFLMSLKKDLKVNPKGKHVLVLGAGGAAKAAVFGLLQSSATSVRIANRSAARARALKNEMARQFKGADIDSLSLESVQKSGGLEAFDLVVNTTSCGLKKNDPLLLTKRTFPKGRKLFVYDMVYNPTETRLLKVAKAAGCATSNGLGMLLYQGAKAFEIWTGKKAPVAVMKRALESALKG